MRPLSPRFIDRKVTRGVETIWEIEQMAGANPGAEIKRHLDKARESLGKLARHSRQAHEWTAKMGMASKAEIDGQAVRAITEISHHLWLVIAAHLQKDKVIKSEQQPGA